MPALGARAGELPCEVAVGTTSAPPTAAPRSASFHAGLAEPVAPRAPAALGRAGGFNLSASTAPRAVGFAFVTAALNAEALAKTGEIALSFWHGHVSAW